MADWLQTFFIYLPLYALFFLGPGLPWALVLLPRKRWRDRPLLLALSLALGPLLSTAWMFMLGSWGRFSVEALLGGIGLLLLLGSGAALLKDRLRRGIHHLDEAGYSFNPYRRYLYNWQPWEKLLFALLWLGFAAQVWNAMFFPFVQYDTLWTFGYNPRLFLLYGQIPDWISYYPQLVPLTYTYGQLFEGEFNDYVAKAAVPWFLLAGGLTAYLLGARVWERRSVGLLTVALWSFVPSALFWSGSGDLEHVVTLYFSGATLFFVLAWRANDPRLALISGLLFSGALWTKPTAGAFALGVGLVIAVTGGLLLLRERFGAGFAAPFDLLNSSAASPRGQFLEKFRLAAVTGLASLPLGSLWYLRNLALGHEAITFPDPHWRDLAQRSGQEFGWLILILLLAVGWMFYTRQAAPAARGGWVARYRPWLLLAGLGLLLLATLPNALNPDLAWTRHSYWDWVRGLRPAAGRLNVLEVLLLLAGLTLLGLGLWDAWTRLSAWARTNVMLLLLLAAPFTAVWFWSYSYHFRLVFTVTPIFACLVAALLDAWLVPMMQRNRLRRATWLFLISTFAMVGIVMGTWLTFVATFVDRLDSEAEKYAEANPSLMEIVDWLREWDAATPEEEGFTIYTMDEKRLNFFFPELRSIYRDSLPTSFDDLEPGTDFVLGGTLADFMWQHYAYYPNQLSAEMDLARAYSRPFIEYRHTILDHPAPVWQQSLYPVKIVDDGVNRFILYEYAPERRYSDPDALEVPRQFEDLVFGGFIALRGLDLRTPEDYHTRSYYFDENYTPVEMPSVAPGARINLQLYWQRSDPNQPPPKNYTVFVHLRQQGDDTVVAQRDAVITEGAPGMALLPMPLMPYPDLVPDRRYWDLPADLAPGVYDLYLGLYDWAAPQEGRVPVTVGGQPVGDGFLIEGIFRVEGE